MCFNRFWTTVELYGIEKRMDTLFLVFSLVVDKRKKASFQNTPHLSNALFFYQRMLVCTALPYFARLGLIQQIIGKPAIANNLFLYENSEMFILISQNYKNYETSN